MVEKGITVGKCHAIHRYTESSFFMYLDANNLYGWSMYQKLPVTGFKWKKNVSKLDRDFIKDYNEDSNKGYILEVDVESPKYLHNLHSDLPFVSEKWKIKKCNKLVCNLYDEKEYVFHIKTLKKCEIMD